MSDKIKCEICSKETNQITPSHLLRSHGITYAEYRDRYPDAPLFSKAALESHRLSRLKLKGRTYSDEHRAAISRGNRKGFGEFLRRATEAHGDRFEYDEQSYKTFKEKVRIRCAEHGWFEQLAWDHIRLKGCRDCSRGKRDNSVKVRSKKVFATTQDATQIIVSRFVEVHGDKYSYDQVIYLGSAKPVKIECLTHGTFEETPSRHIRGLGCKKCSGRHRWTTEEWIENAKQVHGNKFDYSKSVYTGALDKITVTCPTHGDFITQPSRHVLTGHGCKRCRGHGRTTEEFIELAKAKFGDRYDYSKTLYENSDSILTIICPVHGEFKQKASYHLANAVGCRDCTYNVSRKETQWIDSFNNPVIKRSHKIKLDERIRTVDGFDPVTNTIYEFWGDWWHGHPDFFDPSDFHRKMKTPTTYGELYQRTLDKKEAILRNGFNLVEIWEHEWDILNGRTPAHRVRQDD